MSCPETHLQFVLFFIPTVALVLEHTFDAFLSTLWR